MIKFVSFCSIHFYIIPFTYLNKFICWRWRQKFWFRLNKFVIKLIIGARKCEHAHSWVCCMICVDVVVVFLKRKNKTQIARPSEITYTQHKNHKQPIVTTKHLTNTFVGHKTKRKKKSVFFFLFSSIVHANWFQTCNRLFVAWIFFFDDFFVLFYVKILSIILSSSFWAIKALSIEAEQKICICFAFLEICFFFF